MNKIVLLWAAAIVALALGASASATTQQRSQTYALAAVHLVEDGATTAPCYAQQLI
jgi:hypothetical protein